jgi:uncharacterized membrane protein YtjA (UPF0391 family)
MVAAAVETKVTVWSGGQCDQSLGGRATAPCPNFRGGLPVPISSGRHGRDTGKDCRRGAHDGAASVQEDAMLYYSIVFLIIALVAGVLGFWGIAGAAAGIAKILFLVFLVLFVVSLVFGRGRSV